MRQKGIVIDIDAHQINNLPNSIDDSFFKIIDKLHTEEKTLFYSILRNDYLENNLNPKY